MDDGIAALAFLIVLVQNLLDIGNTEDFCDVIDQHFQNFGRLFIRDEFENAFAQFRADVECGTITLFDGDGNPIDLSTDGDCIIDHVKDVYFKNYERDEDVIEVL